MLIRTMFTLLLFFSVAVGLHSQVTLSMEEALELSLTTNPNLLAASARTKAAQASVRQATGNFLPALYLNAGYTKYQEPNIITPIHEVGVFPALDDEIYNANLSLSLPIFDGGRRWSIRKIAKSSERENRANKQLVKQTLLQQVSEIYLLAKQVQEQALLIGKRLESLHQRYNDLLAMETEGRVQQGDVALVASTLASAQADSIAVVVSQRQIALRLGLLVGKSVPVVPLVSSLNIDIERESTKDSLFTDITGPALLSAKARQEKTEAVASVAKRSLWPEVSVFGTYIYRSGTSWDPIGEWVAGVKISLPIFQGGTRMNKIRESNALATASTQAVVNARLEQNTNLQIAYSDYLSSRERYQLLTQAEKEKIISVQSQNELYEAGRIPLRDLNVQELELLQIQFDKNKLLFSAQSALLRYELIAGNLTKEKAMLIAGGIQ